MSKFVRDFIEVKECCSLDALIERLAQIRDQLPESARAEVKMRGDDVFGRQLSISFYREQTAQEAECDARCAAALEQAREREAAERDARDRRFGGLRAAA